MNPIGLLSNIMLDALKFFSFFGGYGWGIIWLTIAVNLALYPLTLSSIKSMAAMQRLQPKMKELQEKHKDNPQEMQKQTMDLYRSEGINPLGGCLPVLLKIPFFLALFWAFQSTAFLGIASDPANNTGFLWISGRVGANKFQSETLVRRLARADLLRLDENATKNRGKKMYVWNVAYDIDPGNSTKDDHLKKLLSGKIVEREEDVEKVQAALKPILKRLSLDEAKDIINAWEGTNSLASPDRVKTPFGTISALALLIGLTTFLMQKSMPSAGQQGQAMAMFMPLFLIFICWNFPAGVQLYWFVSNSVAAVQQFYIMKKPHRRHKKKGTSISSGQGGK